MSADPSRLSSRKSARREAILDAAERLIVSQGLDFEVSELAKEAGISNGLAYHYFGSKDGVLEATIDRFYARYSAVVDRPADPEIAWAVREHRRLLETVTFLYTDPFAPTVFGGLGHAHAITRDIASQQAMVANAAHNVRSGQRRGHIPTEIDAQLAGAAIVGAMRSMMAHAMRMNPRPSPDKLVEQIWQIIEGAVSPRSEFT